jgi:hemerythrin-like domain-containing protein
MDEHRHIERMLDCLEAIVVVFWAERRIDAALAREAVGFLQEVTSLTFPAASAA